MTTALDTNILVALWDRNDLISIPARRALDAALDRGGLVVSGPVFAELLADPRRSEYFIEGFFKETGISIDWTLDEAIWRVAGLAFQTYTKRRRRQKTGAPRRILTDFLIGAHALVRKYPLLTFDTGHFRAAFPTLRMICE
ncbi:MAG: type II toxin-antitoxin system VapC family toxin [Chloracidobacterium sp.]|nr:type II toxin-antitoxin system VapC family toxin [Chloracidobacterium sp.]